MIGDSRLPRSVEVSGPQTWQALVFYLLYTLQRYCVEQVTTDNSGTTYITRWIYSAGYLPGGPSLRLTYSVTARRKSSGLSGLSSELLPRKTATFTARLTLRPRDLTSWRTRSLALDFPSIHARYTLYPSDLYD